MHRHLASGALLAFAALLLVPSIVHAQQQPGPDEQATGTIYGTVVNTRSGEPMPGVQVMGPRVVRTEGERTDGPCWQPPRRRYVTLEAETGEDGAYRIENVPAGQHHLAIHLPEQRIERRVTVRPGGQHEVNFRPSVTPTVPPAQPGEGATLFGIATDSETGERLPGVNVTVEGMNVGASTDREGRYEIDRIPVGEHTARASFVGFETQEQTVTLERGERLALGFALTPASRGLEEVVMTGYAQTSQRKVAEEQQLSFDASLRFSESAASQGRPPQRFNTESYDRIRDNEWQTPRSYPLSTFSIDVDAASYANTRRFLCEGRLPPKDAVRIEELVNYFDYDYPQPAAGEAPFSITTEVGAAPWNPAHRLVHVGLQGRELTGEAPPSNLVFLLDVSGSMDTPRKLPLLKESFRTLTERLGPQDRVAIVVYAGSSGLVLDSTPGSEQGRILEALGRLEAGGSTAGAAGIQLAYQVAQDNFIEGGNNRVILATDGDFNVGPSSDAEMERLIEEKRESGVFLTTLGFGTGNVKDSKMEALADHGNGNYYYLDSPRESEKVLGRELTSTLFTIAKDVKIQVEFNPAEVERYRLIGYVNRLLDKEDFADDTKDAGDLGAGHTVTALYEIVPGRGTDGEEPTEDDLRYQTGRGLSGEAEGSGELMQVRLRYKAPDGDTSRLLAQTLRADDAHEARSENFAFSAAVAGFGMLLRDSEYKSDLTTGQVLDLAREGRGADPYGDRAELIQLVERYRDLAQEGVERAVSRRR